MHTQRPLTVSQLPRVEPPQEGHAEEQDGPNQSAEHAHVPRPSTPLEQTPCPEHTDAADTPSYPGHPLSHATPQSHVPPGQMQPLPVMSHCRPQRPVTHEQPPCPSQRPTSEVHAMGQPTEHDGAR